MTGGMSSSFTVLLAWVGSTFPRPRTTRAVAYGTVNMLGNSESIGGVAVMLSVLTVSGADLVSIPVPREHGATLHRKSALLYITCARLILTVPDGLLRQRLPDARRDLAELRPPLVPPA